MNKRFLIEAEGEGFEPSRGLTTPNGFRDRLKSANLQGVYSQFASKFASAAHTVSDGGGMRFLMTRLLGGDAALARALYSGLQWRKPDSSDF